MHTRHGTLVRRLPGLLVSVTLLATTENASAQVSDLGQIDFPNSGSDAAQEAFLRGALLLHSFEYEDAAESFREAQEIDPDFALAYWGEALTYSHPIWEEDYPDEARAALARLAPTPAERIAKAPTDREQGFLRAVEALYATDVEDLEEAGLSRIDRNRAYSRAMATLHDRYPDDLEVMAFYSVSVLGTSGPGRDVPTYMRAAAIAEAVYEKNADHPGALHYAIHSYDDPEHAYLGLRMARRYARVAPAAQHALHMPSHIFVALGMWEDSAASNEDSSAAADARRERKGLGIDARGFHSLYWLLYTYLQLGRMDDARHLLENMVRDENEKSTKRTRYHLAVMRAAYLVGTEDWDGPAADIEVDYEELGLNSTSLDQLALGIAALTLGDTERAAALLDEMRVRRAKVTSGEIETDDVTGCCLPGSLEEFDGLPPGRQAAIVMEQELDGLLHLARGQEQEGLERLRNAARDEDAMDFDAGPPVVVKPAHELLGETLLSLKRPEEARPEFEAALRRAPRRAQSLLGLARALAQTGERELARATYKELAGIRHAADHNCAHGEEIEEGAGTP